MEVNLQEKDSVTERIAYAQTFRADEKWNSL